MYNKLLVLLFVAVFFSCKNDKSTSYTSPYKDEYDSLHQLMRVGDSIGMGSNASSDFSKKLSIGELEFDITGKLQQAAPISTVNMKITKGGNPYFEIKEGLDGKVTDAIATDIDNDGNPEIYVFSYGTRGLVMGTVAAYEFNKEAPKKLLLGQPEESATVGYRGGDEFKIDGKKLLRTFPIYLDDDKDGDPHGGKRIVEYELNALSQLEPKTYSEE